MPMNIKDISLLYYSQTYIAPLELENQSQLGYKHLESLALYCGQSLLQL
jgi:hypothetical protein